MNLTALIALVIIVGLAILGYVRGLIKSVWHFAGAIIVIALTLMFAPTVANALNNNEKLREKVHEKVSQTLNIKVPNADGAAQEALNSKVEDLKLPSGLEEMFKKYISETGDSVNRKSADMVESLYDKVTTTVITGIAYIVTLIVVLIICLIAVWLLNKFFTLPGLNAVNKIGGLLIGLAEGVIIVWAFCGFVSVFAATEWGATVIGHIQENPVLRYFYEHNLISAVISAKLMLSK